MSNNDVATQIETAKTSKLRENNGKNKRYSLKVQPKAATKDVVDYRNGEIDYSSEEAAISRFKSLVEKNTELLEKGGVKISLYHYRMPKLVAGKDVVSSKEYVRKNDTTSEVEVVDEVAS
jgi:hypothetical protein